MNSKFYVILKYDPEGNLVVLTLFRVLSEAQEFIKSKYPDYREFDDDHTVYHDGEIIKIISMDFVDMIDVDMVRAILNEYSDRIDRNLKDPLDLLERGIKTIVNDSYAAGYNAAAEYYIRKNL
jgi:hypothetical protein